MRSAPRARRRADEGRRNTYSALNAVAGHYNNFGTKYIFPAKRAERVMKELSDAEQLLTRGR